MAIKMTQMMLCRRFLNATGAKFDTLCDRTIMLIPIKDWAYAPVSDSLTEWAFKEHQEWVLVIEENGNTWIWDSWILEG